MVYNLYYFSNGGEILQKSTEIDYLIDEMIENDFIDFKSEFYKKDNKRERIKDIVAFANSHSNEPSRYIIFGIKWVIL